MTTAGRFRGGRFLLLGSKVSLANGAMPVGVACPCVDSNARAGSGPRERLYKLHSRNSAKIVSSIKFDLLHRIQATFPVIYMSLVFLSRGFVRSLARNHACKRQYGIALIFKPQVHGLFQVPHRMRNKNRHILSQISGMRFPRDERHVSAPQTIPEHHSR